MNHREKLRIARRMMTKYEIEAHISPFQSKACEKRKKNKETRARNKEVARSYYKS